MLEKVSKFRKMLNYFHVKPVYFLLILNCGIFPYMLLVHEWWCNEKYTIFSPLKENRDIFWTLNEEVQNKTEKKRKKKTLAQIKFVLDLANFLGWGNFVLEIKQNFFCTKNPAKIFVLEIKQKYFCTKNPAKFFSENFCTRNPANFQQNILY